MPDMTSDKRTARRALGRSASPGRAASVTPQLAIEPIDTSFSFKNKAYAALKNVIVSMDIYRSRSDIRLDERKLAQDFVFNTNGVRDGEQKYYHENGQLAVQVMVQEGREDGTLKRYTPDGQLQQVAQFEDGAIDDEC